MSEIKLIRTENKLPPEGKWVLVTTGDFQKTFNVACYLGKSIQAEAGAWTTGMDTITEPRMFPKYWADIDSLLDEV